MKHQFRIEIRERRKPFKPIEGMPPIYTYTGLVTVDEACRRAKEFWKENGSREDWTTVLWIEDR